MTTMTTTATVRKAITKAASRVYRPVMAAQMMDRMTMATGTPIFVRAEDGVLTTGLVIAARADVAIGPLHDLALDLGGI